MTKEEVSKYSCCFCKVIITSKNLKELNNELNKHIILCKDQEKLLEEGKCVCGKKTKSPLISHMKKCSKVFKKLDKFSIIEDKYSDHSKEVIDTPKTNADDNNETEDNDEIPDFENDGSKSLLTSPFKEIDKTYCFLFKIESKVR